MKLDFGDPAAELAEAGRGWFVAAIPGGLPSLTPLSTSLSCELAIVEGSVSGSLLGLWDLRA